MEFWAALIGALVGAAAGGGVTYWVNTAQWKRQRREAAMEEFLILAGNAVDAWETESSQKHPSMMELGRQATLLDLHAGWQVAEAARNFLRAEQEARSRPDDEPWLYHEIGSGRWFDYMNDSWVKSDAALTGFRVAMLKRIKSQAPKDAID